jgi:O-antigen ligase
MLVVTLLLESLIIVASWRLGDLPIPGSSTRLDPSAVATGHAARSGGTIGSPNAAGSFLSLLLAPALGLLVAPVSRRLKRLAAASFAVGVVALVLTLSRGGWLAFAVSTLIIAVVATRAGLVPKRNVVAVALAGLVLALPFAGVIQSRAGVNDESAQARWPLMMLAWEMVEDQPLLGVGANNFSLHIAEYAGPEFTSEWLYAVHNKFMQVWAEAGTFALLAFLWFMAATLRRGRLVWRARDPVLAPLALGLAAGCAGQIANMAVETYHGRAQVQLLWLAAALLAAMAAMHVRRGERA